MSSQKSAIEISHLQFEYPSAKKAVLDIPEFSLGTKERLFLYGPSGSGKSTFLGLISGILNPTQGSLRVLGEDYSQLTGSARDHFRGEHIGYIFQMFNLIPYLSVIDNILLPCRLNKKRGDKISDLLLEAKKLMDRLSIGELIHQPVTQLSVGQQQRVATARALLGEPQLIIADEPTSALDYNHREAFMDLLLSEAERISAAVLFVSHDKSLQSAFDRVVSLAEMNEVKL